MLLVESGEEEAESWSGRKEGEGGEESEERQWREGMPVCGPKVCSTVPPWCVRHKGRKVRRGFLPLCIHRLVQAVVTGIDR